MRNSGSAGAAVVEQLVAYLPVMLTFFSGLQLAEVTTAQLVLNRAASAAARAAAVVLPDDPSFYSGELTNEFLGLRADDIRLATAMVLSASPQLRGDFTVDVAVPPEVPKSFGLLTATVSAIYECGIVRLLCGVRGNLSLKASVQHAYHRAEYKYPPYISTPSTGSAGGTSTVNKSKRGHIRPPSQGPVRKNRPGQTVSLNMTDRQGRQAKIELVYTTRYIHAYRITGMLGRCRTKVGYVEYQYKDESACYETEETRSDGTTYINRPNIPIVEIKYIEGSPTIRGVGKLLQKKLGEMAQRERGSALVEAHDVAQDRVGSYRSWGFYPSPRLREFVETVLAPDKEEQDGVPATEEWISGNVSTWCRDI